MNKIRIGTVYPGYMGDYSEMDWVDLDEMNPLDLADLIKEMVSELRKDKEGEGELVIVPFEEKKEDANKDRK